MDTTLREYLDSADLIHNLLINNGAFIDINKINNKLCELESYIKQIQGVSFRIAHIYNNCKKSTKRIIINKPFSSSLNPLPKNRDWTNMYKYINNLDKLDNIKEIAPEINIKIQPIDNIDDLPNTQLYWVKSLNQFAFCIGGVVFRGNIGNIYTKNQNKNKIFYEKCKYGNSCQLTKCKYYHDPLLLKNNQNAENAIRNFNNSSWLYSNNIHSKTLRVFGNRQTLKSDLTLIREAHYKDDMIDRYLSQTMHDILVSLAVNQCNLINNKVKFISNKYTGKNDIILT